MPRTADRGGPKTRARIAEVAAALFVERGFDAVTVSEVARAAGVSAVTVFNHFPRKEDLFLDRSEEAENLLRAAVDDRPGAAAAIDALEETLVALVDARHPLSGLHEDSLSFFRTVAASQSLTDRVRHLLAELELALARGLAGNTTPDLDSLLLAAFFTAGYAAVFRHTAQQRLAGATADRAETELRDALDRLFAALRDALAAAAPATS